jgi:hypothetical protein
VVAIISATSITPPPIASDNNPSIASDSVCQMRSRGLGCGESLGAEQEYSPFRESAPMECVLLHIFLLEVGAPQSIPEELILEQGPLKSTIAACRTQEETDGDGGL